MTDTAAEPTCIYCGQTKEQHDNLVCEAVRVSLKNKIERTQKESQ